MSKKTSFSFAALGTALGVYSIIRSQHEKLNRIQSLHQRSEIIDTSLGPIETEIIGEGPDVLVAHGALGGHDRARLYSFPEAGFRFICPSRPGYLRTPLSVGHSFEQQADGFAALLDELGIEKAAIVGCSAGGPVAVQFAYRHPDRCWGLVLGNAITGPLSSVHGSMKQVARLLFDWDWLTWFGVNRLVLFALRPKLFHHVRGDQGKQEKVIAMLKTMYPTSLRRAGFVNDMEQIDKNFEYPLSELKVPTMVIHGTSDMVVPFSHGLRSADHIPGAQLLSIESGTHLDFLSHPEQIQPKITAFFNQHKPNKSVG